MTSPLNAIHPACIKDAIAVGVHTMVRCPWCEPPMYHAYQPDRPEFQVEHERLQHPVVTFLRAHRWSRWLVA